MSSSSTLDHTCRRAAACSCEPISAYFEEDEGRQTKRRRLIVNPELPEDVLLEILPRLPVKSLVRFKSVCKFWYDLIKSPKFMSLHDTNSMKKSVSLYYHSCNYNYPATISFRLFDVPMHLKVRVSVELVKLVGCVNGLVCLSLSPRHHKFALWNPATTEYRLIFETESSRPKDEDIYSGFCFDSVANSYKVVRATFFPINKSLFMVQVPEGFVYVILYVFTLNDNSWRRKELLSPSRFLNGGAMSETTTYVGRCMYWTVSGGYMVPGKYILCFDMVDEVFKIIEFPCVDHSCCGTKLLDYKGSLAMFIWNKSVSKLPERSFDMWVLNDCGGTNKSWCKQLTFTPSVSYIEKALGFFSKGDVDVVVLSDHYHYQCLLWDKDSGETTKLESGNGWVYPFFLYRETFASVY